MLGWNVKYLIILNIFQKNFFIKYFQKIGSNFYSMCLNINVLLEVTLWEIIFFKNVKLIKINLRLCYNIFIIFFINYNV